MFVSVHDADIAVRSFILLDPMHAASNRRSGKTPRGFGLMPLCNVVRRLRIACSTTSDTAWTHRACVPWAGHHPFPGAKDLPPQWNGSCTRASRLSAAHWADASELSRVFSACRLRGGGGGGVPILYRRSPHDFLYITTCFSSTLSSCHRFIPLPLAAQVPISPDVLGSDPLGLAGTPASRLAPHACLAPTRPTPRGSACSSGPAAAARPRRRVRVGTSTQAGCCCCWRGCCGLRHVDIGP